MSLSQNIYKLFQALAGPGRVNSLGRRLRNFAAAPGDGLSRRAGGPVRTPPGKAILFIDINTPRFDQDSGSLRAFSIMRLLAGSGLNVCFMLRDGDPCDSYCKALEVAGVKVLREGEAWEAMLEGSIGLAVVFRLLMADQWIENIRRKAPWVTVAYDTVDVHFVRDGRQAEVEKSAILALAARLVKKRELGLAGMADLTIATTAADAGHMLREAPSLNIAVIPNVHKRVEVEHSVEGRDAVMFIGGFKHGPNADAVVFFLKDIYPLIAQELGKVEFLVVGSSPTAEVLGLASDTVTVTGYVQDIAPYYARTRVFVSPLRYGAGMKGKVGEAMSFGVPVVTTAVGAEGMGLVHGETALIQDDPKAFATEVVRLFRDETLWRKLSVQGREYVEKNFGEGAVREMLLKLVRPERKG